MAEFGGEPRNFRDKFWYLATTNTKIASGRETAAGRCPKKSRVFDGEVGISAVDIALIADWLKP